MEEDGASAQELDWQYENVPDGGIQEQNYQYSGADPSLHHKIANKFSTPLEACGVVGGFMYDLIKCITANSNAYADRKKRNNHFAGSVWSPISVEEMYHALGIILKMSIHNHQIGGWASYFHPPSKMKYGPGQCTKIDVFLSSAADIMTSYRFRQNHVVLHPESGTSLVGENVINYKQPLNL